MATKTFEWPLCRLMCSPTRPAERELATPSVADLKHGPDGISRARPAIAGHNPKTAFRGARSAS
eukprot:11214121-Lingulodinium_polyedra.AAC.1